MSVCHHMMTSSAACLGTGLIMMVGSACGLLRLEPGELIPDCCSATLDNQALPTCCLPPGQTCKTVTYAVDAGQAFIDFVTHFQASLAYLLKADEHNNICCRWTRPQRLMFAPKNAVIPSPSHWLPATASSMRCPTNTTHSTAAAEAYSPSQPAMIQPAGSSAVIAPMGNMHRLPAA